MVALLLRCERPRLDHRLLVHEHNLLVLRRRQSRLFNEVDGGELTEVGVNQCHITFLLYLLILRSPRLILLRCDPNFS